MLSSLGRREGKVCGLWRRLFEGGGRISFSFSFSFSLVESGANVALLGSNSLFEAPSERLRAAVLVSDIARVQIKA